MKSKNRILKRIALIFILLLWSSYASAYEACQTTGGADIMWPSPPVGYYINTSGGPSGTSGAVQAGANAWSHLLCSNFVFIYTGATTSTDHGVNDGINIVTFGPLALGTIAVNASWYTTITGEMVDSDIRFNSNLSWSTDLTSGSYDVQDLGTHEFGHTLCLADLYAGVDSEKTMYGFGATDETKKRTLHYDDIDGINYLYPWDGDDYYEQNDSLATAYYPGGNWEQVWLCDILGSGCGVQSDEDWYEIYVTSGYERVQIDLQFSDAEGNIDVCLYNSSGTSLACSTSITDDEYIDHIVPSGGTYYIRLYGNNAGNAYDLWWDDVYVAQLEPDLIVQSISTNPVSPAPGESVNVTVTVENQGSGDATNSFWVDFYKDLTTPPVPSQVGDEYCNIASLAAGATTTCDGTVTYGTAGTYDMWAQVDTDDQVGESEEGNNILGPQVIHVLEGNVSVSLSPDAITIPRGGTLGYWVTATNNTGSTQCFHYWTNVKLPSGITHPPSGELKGPVYLCLSAYDSRNAHLSHGIPIGAPLGVYTYNAFVGPYSTVWDEDHFNFTVTSSLTMEGPQDWNTTLDKNFLE